MATTAQIREHFKWLQDSQGLSGKALYDQVYKDAKNMGVSASQLARGTGLSLGDINTFISQNNLAPLSGSGSASVSSQNTSARPTRGGGSGSSSSSSSGGKRPNVAMNNAINQAAFAPANRFVDAIQQGARTARDSAAPAGVSSQNILSHVQGLEAQGLTGDQLHNKIWEDAQANNIPPEQIEQALGMAPGTVNQWLSQRNYSAPTALTPGVAPGTSTPDGTSAPMTPGTLTPNGIPGTGDPAALTLNGTPSTVAPGTSTPNGTPSTAAPATPDIGLIGAEQALTGGLQGADSVLREGMRYSQDAMLQGQQSSLDALNRGQNMLGGETLGVIDMASQPLQAQAMQGRAAQMRQAALSGAMGPAAQQAAYAEFQASPGQAFLREEAERGTLRNAAATGGLGGGNVQQELQRQAMGLAAQDFGNYYDRISGVAGAGERANFQQSNINQALGGNYLNSMQQNNMFSASMPMQTAQFLSGQGANAASQGADLYANVGNSLASNRFNTGLNVSSMLGGVSDSLAGLQNQQGNLGAGMVSDASTNVANLLSGSGVGVSDRIQDTGNQLANIAVGQGTQATGLGKVPGVQDGGPSTADQASQWASALGTVALVAASDIRLKKNIVSIGRTPGGHNVYIWDWIDDRTQPNIGVIAQEIIESVPDAVGISDDGFFTVDYSRIS